MTNCPYCGRMRSRCVCLFGALLLLTLNACGGDAFFYIGPLTDAGPDAIEPDSDAARADAPELDAGNDADAAKPDGATCPYVGSVACADVINSYCSHYASCCSQFPGNGKCTVGWSSAGTCKTDLAQSGFDCNSSKYNKLVCGGPTQCMTNTGSSSCSVIFQSTGPSDNVFPGCQNFWGQFP